MSYQSPIELFQTNPFIEHLRDETDNLILRAVIHANVNVDKEELIKALEYDRGQYEKGFLDGRTYVPPCPTKADRIRAMTDDELAEWLVMVEQRIIERNPMLERPALYADWLDWLKSPVEEVDDGT